LLSIVLVACLVVALADGLRIERGFELLRLRPHPGCSCGR